ncbi:MAG: hypothetical protein LBP33_10025 [Candidatus Adiutrix sp.]|jgi:tRNA (guanine-N7-)-methyltransferase|nr:hypothetical protein [Candidatus Adiutrix sp.]
MSGAFSKKYYRSLEPLIKPVDHPRPLDWAEIFGRRAPLELEIGFGNGEFLHSQSLARPERDYVGVEIAWASAKRALRRLAGPPRPNARVMIMKAESALARCFAPESLSVIRSLFPIPWPDERQEKRRLFQRAFLDLAASRLTPDGLFSLVTDSPELAGWTMEQAGSSALALTMEERPPEMNTKYERKWQGGGRRNFYHLQGRKTARPPISVPEEPPMQACYREDFDPRNYQPRGCADQVVVKFKEFVFDPLNKQGLLRSFVLEGPLTQEFFIRISFENGRWKFSPAIASQLFPTHGLARALELACAGAGPPTGPSHARE